MSDLIIGIKVGGTKVSGGLVSREGEVQDSFTLPTLAGEGFEASFRQTMLVIETLVSRSGRHNIIGIGIYVPAGGVDPQSGADVPNLPRWQEVQWTQRIRERFLVPVRVVAEPIGFADSGTDLGAIGIAAGLFRTGMERRPPQQKPTDPLLRLKRLALALIALGSIAGLIFYSNSNLGRHAYVPVPAPVPSCDPREASFCRVQVFFATDRKLSGQSTPANFFSGERSDENVPLTFGSLEVSIPARHKTGHIEEPLPFFKADPTHDVVIINLNVAPESQFFSSLANAVNGSRNKEALVFIHGYDVSFDEAARRTAQLTWDLGFRGIPILFSWPSRGAKIMYSADEASALWAVPHLEQFLRMIARRSGATTIHVIAHSLGNRPLMYALQQITLQHSLSDSRFDQIVLAAPDIDVGIFRQLATVFPSIADRVTIYASAHDKALEFSKILHQSFSVGGQTRPSHAVPGVDVIDASAMSEDLLDVDHSYYAANITVLEDMGYIIRVGLPPAKRALLDPHPSSGTPMYWSFRH